MVKSSTQEIGVKWVDDKPTIVVTFIIDGPDSTYLVDFDKRLNLKEPAWIEMEKESRLGAMIDNFKLIIPTLMINREANFEVIEIEETPSE